MQRHHSTVKQGVIPISDTRADVGFGATPWLVISNNQRNRHASDLLALRLTTTAKQLPTWVPLSAADPTGGHAVFVPRRDRPV